MSVLYDCEKWPTKAVGVTFANPDGSSRQQILADLHARHPGGLDGVPIELREYRYEGAPAFYVVVGGQIVGNLSAKLADQLHRRLVAGWSAVPFGPRLFCGQESGGHWSLGFTLALLTADQARQLNQEQQQRRPDPLDHALAWLIFIIGCLFCLCGLACFGRDTFALVGFFCLGSALIIWSGSRLFCK